MTDIRAFRGFRYDPGHVGALSGVIAPPYDVIDAPLQQSLLAKSPYNAVRVELAKEQPGDTDAKYEKAAQTLRDWLAADVLRQDSARGLYVVEQRFTIEGREFVRRGFFARVRLVPFGQGLFPHEETLSGPKADRLKLMRATGFNLSPIFSLYPDDGATFAPLERAIRGAPPWEAVDHLGTVNRLWLVTDAAVVNAVIGSMGTKSIFIADGHHRYETALNYLQKQQVDDPDHPANFCLMMLTGMSDPGLIIQPTHRLLRGIENLTAAEWKAKLAPHFDIVEDSKNARDCWETIELDGSQRVFGFGTTDGHWFVARLHDDAAMAVLAPEHSPAWRGFGVSILQRLVLETILQNRPHCDYVHLISEVEEAMDAKRFQLACLVPAAAMEHVEGIAGNLEKMPPKSTYFYPKLPTGLVFNSLKKD